MMGETGPMGLHSKGRKTDMKTAAKRERKTLRIVELALLLGAAAFLMTGVWALNTQRDLADKVVRLHVLANSDTEEDQALKLLVRDAVLERATEILEQSADRAEAEIRLRESLPELEAIAEETVRANGYDYAVTAELEDMLGIDISGEPIHGDAPDAGGQRGDVEQVEKRTGAQIGENVSSIVISPGVIATSRVVIPTKETVIVLTLSGISKEK